MKKMKDFITDNYKELVDFITGICPETVCDYDEIELWVWKDESLYLWAIDEGVDIDE